MRAHLVNSPIGFFAFADDGTLLHYDLAPQNPDRAVQRLQEPVSNEFRATLQGYDLVEDDDGYAMLRPHVREYAVSLGFVPNDAALTAFIRRVGIALSHIVLGHVIQRDKLIIQSVHALDDTAETLNLFYERLYEWYSLHYPEVLIDKHALAKAVVSHGNRNKFPGFSKSRGVDMTPADESILQQFAATTLALHNTNVQLEQYLQQTARELMPNVCALIDPLLASRLLAIAGSLEKLAKMPSSTIQLLGAEKALFRHLKKKGKSPKYGILFTSIAIQQAPLELKGKVARILASKLMIAARIDFYSGRNETVRLSKEFQQELEAVKHGTK